MLKYSTHLWSPIFNFRLPPCVKCMNLLLQFDFLLIVNSASARISTSVNRIHSISLLFYFCYAYDVQFYYSKKISFTCHHYCWNNYYYHLTHGHIFICSRHRYDDSITLKANEYINHLNYLQPKSQTLL